MIEWWLKNFRASRKHLYQNRFGVQIIFLCLALLLFWSVCHSPAVAGNGFPRGDYYNQSPSLEILSYIPNCPSGNTEDTEQFTNVPAGWFAIGLRPDIVNDGQYIINKYNSPVSSWNSLGTNFLVKNFTEVPDRDDPDFHFELCASSWGTESDAWEREYMIEWDNQHSELPLNYDVQGSFSGSNIIDAWPVSLTAGYTYTFTMSINSLVDSDDYPGGADLHLFLIKDTGQWLNQNDAVYDLEVHHTTSASASGEYVVGASAGGNYVVVVVNNSASYEYLLDPRPQGDYVIHIEDSATPPDTPNLQVESITVSDPADTDDPINIGFNIRNVGNADAAASVSSVAVDGGPLYNNLPIGSLYATTGQQSQNCSIGPLTAGTHTVTVCADAGLAVHEGNELDNCLQRNFTVGEVDSPSSDLIIINVHPISGVEGQPVSILALVKNIGALPSPPCTGSILVDMVARNEVLNLEPLLVGDTKFTNFANLGPLDVGSHTITVTINDPNPFYEKNKTNNTFTKIITITPAPKPDLVVEQISPLDVNEDQEFSLSVVVKNQGQANALACTGKFFLNNTMIWFSPIPALAAGTSQVITMREGNGWNAGTYPLSFTADYDDKVEESIEGNNTLGVQIIVRPRTVMVYPDGHGPYPTSQAGVDAVALGGTVQLAAGTFTGAGNRDIDFHGRNVNIRGADDIGSTIDCQAGVDSHIAFILAGQESQVNISNIRVINGGNEFFGGAIYASGLITAVIENCIFEDNIANVGGAIEARAGANLTIRRCRFLGNRGNTTSPGGGAIHGDDVTLFISDSLFWKNRGAAIVLYNSQLAIRNATLDANDDGIVLNGAYPALDMKRTIISNSSGQALINTAGVAYYIVCSDFYNNSGGNWLGGPDAKKGQISSNPLFCDPDHMDFSLHADSPCALATCGFMGAFPIGCGSASDTDNDGMDDDWERTYFGNLDHPGGDDSDHDGLSDATEFKYDMNPILADTDRDGMPDGFEFKYGFEPANAADAFLDADGDGACNLREYTGGTSPRYAASLPAAGIIHVSVAAIGNPVQVGSADLPFATIQQGVDMTTLGDTVLVHPGTYTGAGNKNILLTGKGITLRSSDGYETTIIDCENNGRGITIGGGTPDSLVVDGFTVTHGNYSWGAGLYIRSSNPTIKNCSFDSNQTITGGGGVGMWGSSPTFDNCLFRNNTAHQNGGAVHVELSYPLFENCEFSENLSAQNDENLFGSGGAIYAHQDSQLQIITSSFWQNSADTSGGAVATVNSDLYCVSIKFVANNAVLDGGGIYCEQAVSPDILNSLFLSNSASYGGGLYLQNTTTAKLVNLTFSDNSADGLFHGGCIYMEDSDAKLQNSIYWSAGSEQGVYLDNSDFEVGYSDGSDVEIGAGSFYKVGAGNLDADPLLTSDGYLSVASPCIDRGGNVLPADEYDLDGDGDVSEVLPVDLDGGLRTWSLNGTTDMGAYEYIENGLMAHYSTGLEVLEGPIFNGHSSDCSSTDNNLYQYECTPIDQSPVDWARGTFNVDWTGYVYAPVGGTYTFSSHYWVDGNIYVKVGDTVVADFNTDGGGYGGQVTLAKDSFTPVTMSFDSNGGSNNMIFGWQPPGKGWEPVPKNFLFPRVTGLSVAIDFDRDSGHDIALFSPDNHKWYIKDQSTPTYGTTDCIPIPGDYDGDGATDLAVVDLTRSDGMAKWYLDGSGVFIYGLQEWIPVPGDYNGDGVTDAAFFNPDTGKWYVRNQFITTYGAGGIPVPGDYNGDGVTDIAVFNPTNNKWYIKDIGIFTYGMADCIPVPADYDGDSATDLAVIDTSRPDGMAKWYIRDQAVFIYGAVDNTIPVPGDYDGDGRADPCLFYQNSGKWYCRNIGILTYGNGSMIPLASNLATRYAISQAAGGSTVW